MPPSVVNQQFKTSPVLFRYCNGVHTEEKVFELFVSSGKHFQFPDTHLNISLSTIFSLNFVVAKPKFVKNVNAFVLCLLGGGYMCFMLTSNDMAWYD